jgi:hypothetical protein
MHGSGYFLSRIGWGMADGDIFNPIVIQIILKLVNDHRLRFSSGQKMG